MENDTPFTVVALSTMLGNPPALPPAPKSTAWVYDLLGLMPESASPVIGAKVNVPAAPAWAARNAMDTASVPARNRLLIIASPCEGLAPRRRPAYQSSQ